MVLLIFCEIITVILGLTCFCFELCIQWCAKVWNHLTFLALFNFHCLYLEWDLQDMWFNSYVMIHIFAWKKSSYRLVSSIHDCGGWKYVGLQCNVRNITNAAEVHNAKDKIFHVRVVHTLGANNESQHQWRRQLWGTGARAPPDVKELKFFSSLWALQSMTAACPASFIVGQ